MGGGEKKWIPLCATTSNAWNVPYYYIDRYTPIYGICYMYNTNVSAYTNRIVFYDRSTIVTYSADSQNGYAHSNLATQWNYQPNPSYLNSTAGVYWINPYGESTTVGKKRTRIAYCHWYEPWTYCYYEQATIQLQDGTELSGEFAFIVPDRTLYFVHAQYDSSPNFMYVQVDADIQYTPGSPQYRNVDGTVPAV